MTDRHAMLAAIKAAPDDDTPRLVFADWLDDRGEHDRAELIRVECEMMRVQTATGRPAPVELQCRRNRVGRLWPDFHGGYEVHINRGILERLVVSWGWWRERGDEVWEKELPWVVHLTTRPARTAGGDIEYVGQTSKTFRYRVAGRVVAVPRATRLDGTPTDYTAKILAARWPVIEFRVPEPAPEGNVDEAGYVRNRLEEHAVDRIADRYNVGEHERHRITRLASLPGGNTGLPTVGMICECSRRVPLPRVDSGPPTESPFRIVELRAEGYGMRLRDRVWHLRVYHGRCARCDRVYYGSGEPTSRSFYALI